MIDLNLSGKKAVVTGASLGIGAAAVKELADLGAEVTFCARSAEAVAELAEYMPENGGGSVIGDTADMSDADSTSAFLARVEENGGADILVNNVGASPSRNFLYMSDDEWQEGFQLNLMSAVRCTRALLPKMRKQKWGRIVMIASAAAKNPGAALIDYGATKAAMISVSKSLAKKYGGDGVLVNSVLPGLIHTSMWERAATEIAEATGSTMMDVINNNGKNVPVGRYGTAEEVAAVIAFLCSNSASYVNGISMEVDGGQANYL